MAFPRDNAGGIGVIGVIFKSRVVSAQDIFIVGAVVIGVSPADVLRYFRELFDFGGIEYRVDAWNELPHYSALWNMLAREKPQSLYGARCKNSFYDQHACFSSLRRFLGAGAAFPRRNFQGRENRTYIVRGFRGAIESIAGPSMVVRALASLLRHVSRKIPGGDCGVAKKSFGKRARSAYLIVVVSISSRPQLRTGRERGY